MTSLERTISLVMSKMREKNQFPRVGEFTIIDDTLVFTQGETFNQFQGEPLVLSTLTPFDEALSITITYNGSLTYDLIIPKYTDQYQVFRIPDNVYEVNNVVTKILSITDETVTKGELQKSDILDKYATSLPSTITDSVGTIYTLDTHYALVDGEIDWNGLNSIEGAVYDPLGVTVTDYTTEINDNTVNDVIIFPAPGTAAVGDLFYIGHSQLFNTIRFDIGQSGAGDYAMTIEYYDGADWNQSPLNIIDATDSFRSVGTRYIQFDEPVDWVQTDVNGITNKYWIRFRLSSITSYTQQPLVTRAWTDKEPKEGNTYTVSYDYLPGGDDGYKASLNILRGNFAKLIYLHEYGMSQIRAQNYKMLNYTVMDNAESDWLKKLAKSWNLIPLANETDDDLRERIITRSSPTNGTTQSIINKLQNFLELSSPPTITETFDSTTWTLNESQLLGANQSELVLSGGDSIKPMQIIVTISSYKGTLTESDIEEYLRTILPVGTSPIVRLS